MSGRNSLRASCSSGWFFAAATLMTGGCGPPSAWNGSGWVDRVDGEIAVVIVAGREVVVRKSQLPSGVSEGDYVRGRTVVPSRRKLAEELAREKLVEIED